MLGVHLLCVPIRSRGGRGRSIVSKQYAGTLFSAGYRLSEQTKKLPTDPYVADCVM
jgi:hypothetical protein